MDTMKQALGLTGNDRMEVMIDIKDRFLSGTLDLDTARTLLKEKIGTCTPDEFAYGEQQLKGSYTDEEITHRMDDLLELFDGILIRANNEYPEHHPLTVYLNEINAMEQQLTEMEGLLQAPHFILNPWLGVYDALTTWRTHLARKQNQLYPVLERYGFDRPTKIMWTFDDAVRDTISESKQLLESGQEAEFLAKQADVIDIIRDLNNKEKEVLIPTAWKLLQDSDFITMSRGDHEIGFAFITPPPFYEGRPDAVPSHHSETSTNTSPEHTVTGANQGQVAQTGLVASTGSASSTSLTGGANPTALLQELAQLVGKYGINGNSEQTHDLAVGSLTIEQITLIFKFLPVDITFVDEKDLVRFYNDTKHRIFPRSSNIIGRVVQNCHPKKSLPLVQEIIDSFRAGKQDYAEMWINKPDLFIHIEYIAVRNEEGQFKGILEMVQDCTHIRSLSGSRKELIWEGSDSAYHAVDHIDYKHVRKEDGPTNTVEQGTVSESAPQSTVYENDLGLTGDTKLFPLFDVIPGLKDHMIHINPNYKMLNSPLAKLMKHKATLSMVAERGEMTLDALIQAILAFKHKNQ